MRKYQREILTILGLVLILAGASAYRQLMMRLSPNDPLCQVVVYLCYLFLLTFWRLSVAGRITQKNMRRFLELEYGVMLFWMTVRFFQESILYQNMPVMHFSGYFISIPIVLMPLFGLYAAFGLGKSEDYRMPKSWYALCLPAAALIGLALTNNVHHLLFYRLASESTDNLYFHPTPLLLLFVLWALLLSLGKLLLIFRRGRKIHGHPFLAAAPFLVIGLFALYSIPYFKASFVVRFEILEYSAGLFLTEILMWEACILLGLVPVNTRYEEVFDRSTIAMQLVDLSGAVYKRSANADALPRETFLALRKDRARRDGHGQVLHMEPIPGGYFIWKSDVSEILSAIAELERINQELESESDLLRQELRTKSRQAAVAEKSRIYDRLSAEMRIPVEKIRTLLAEMETSEQPNVQMTRIYLIGAYLKHRCSLRLGELSGESVDAETLRIAFRDMTDVLRLSGFSGELVPDIRDCPEQDFVILVCDAAIAALGEERFGADCLSVRLSEADGPVHVFSCEIQISGKRFGGRIPEASLRALDPIGCEWTFAPAPDGYRARITHKEESPCKT